MKNVYLFIVLLATSLDAAAKGEYQPMVTAGPVVNGKFPHLGNQIVNTTTGSGGTEPTKISLRLIGRTYTTFSAGAFVPVDSYYYRYENDRGGVLANDNIDNDETLLYSESIYYKFDPNSAGFVNNLRRTQEYWTGDFINKVRFLTYQPWKAKLVQFQDSARYGYQYYKSGSDYGKMKESTFERYYANMWTNDITSSITYQSNVTTMQSDFYKVDFIYDANARLVEMVDGQNLGNGVWQNKEKHTYEYTGSNVAKHVFSEWSAQLNTWVNSKNWLYTYSGNDLISEVEQEWNGTGWDNISKHEYTYDGNHNMTTDLKKVWNSVAFVDASKEVWTYNIQNLPELITTSTWNGNAWVYTDKDKQYRLYYENFFPAEVEQVAGNRELSVYPVPAVDMVNVNMTLNSSEDISVSLYDVKGAALYSASHPAVKNLQTAIPVASLPAGTYFLRVSGNNTNIARSIVVQH